MTMWRPSADAAARLQKEKQRVQGLVKVGRFETATRPCWLGGLAGNRFQIKLRGIEYDSVEKMKEAAHKCSLSGALNTFGNQRFGVGPISNDRIGEAILRSDFHKALALALHRIIGDLIGEGTVDFSSALCDERVALRCAESNQGVTAIKLKSTEKKLLSSIASLGVSDPERVLRDALPRNLRRLYVESWQSAVFNELAGWRMKHLPSEVTEGDIVLVTTDPAASGASGKKGLSAWDVSAVKKNGHAPHLVSADDATSGIFTFEHVVVPLLGSKVRLPKWAPTLISDLVERDMATIVAREHKSKEYTLKGSYRHLIVVPKNLEVLQCGDDSEATQVSFDLPPAAYATELVAKLASEGAEERGSSLRSPVL